MESLQNGCWTLVSLTEESVCFRQLLQNMQTEIQQRVSLPEKHWHLISGAPQIPLTEPLESLRRSARLLLNTALKAKNRKQAYT